MVDGATGRSALNDWRGEPLPGRPGAEVMKVADDALYRARQRGGDEILAFADRAIRAGTAPRAGHG